MSHTISFADQPLVTVNNASLAGVIKWEIQSATSASEAKRKALAYIKSTGNQSHIAVVH